MFSRFWRDRRGTTVIEYGLILVCLSLVVVGGAQKAGEAIDYLFGEPTSALQQGLE